VRPAGAGVGFIESFFPLFPLGGDFERGEEIRQRSAAIGPAPIRRVSWWKKQRKRMAKWQGDKPFLFATHYSLFARLFHPSRSRGKYLRTPGMDQFRLRCGAATVLAAVVSQACASFFAEPRASVGGVQRAAPGRIGDVIGQGPSAC